MPDRPHLQPSAPSASPEEAAAVVAALERFMRATAPAISAAVPELDRWTQVAILEGVEREEPLSGSWAATFPRH